MRYRITLTFFDSPLIGATYQYIGFDAPDDNVATEHFHYEARSGWLHCGAALDRIDQPEIITELQKLASDELGDDQLDE